MRGLTKKELESALQTVGILQVKEDNLCNGPGAEPYKWVFTGQQLASPSQSVSLSRAEAALTYIHCCCCCVASLVSNSVYPHRRQPTRLPRPWDSPGKNTGVGCHFLLQCMKVKGESEVAQSCPTLSNLMDSSLPGSSVHGIFQARVLEWGAIAFSDIHTTVCKTASRERLSSPGSSAQGSVMTERGRIGGVQGGEHRHKHIADSLCWTAENTML